MRASNVLAWTAIVLSAASALAQQGTLPEKMAFEVASVRQNKSAAKPSSNIALGPGDVQGPTFEQAMQKQLGLKLESQKGPVDFVVVDHVEQASRN